MPTPLPRPNPFESTHLPLSRRAYHRCLDLEDRHTSVKMSGKLTVLICARFLGYMLVEVPVDAGREDFASEVVGCTDDEALQALANLYKNHLIRCFLHNKGRTPVPTLHPSGPSSDVTTDEDIPPLRATPTSHSEAKQQALIRDRHRCILTGRIDSAPFQAGVVEDGSDLTVTRASHIFNWPTNGGLEADNKRHYATSVLAMLSRFGKIDINELNGASIHRLQNVLTLDSNLHEWFGQLDIWLERRPEDPVDYYRLGATIPNFIRRVPAEIQLTTPDPVKYPLPDPRYLAIHAACARVAHLSGAAEYIEVVFHEMEKTDVLARDGGSGDVLYHALIRHVDLDV